LTYVQKSAIFVSYVQNKRINMKIAIPVKMNKENTALSPLFGKAKWIAFVEDGKVDIVPNITHGGRAVVEWFVREGIDNVIFQEMGQTPYEMVKSVGTIELFHAGHERILLNDVLERFTADKLILINDTNIGDILAHHEKKHPHVHTTNKV